MDYSAIVTGLQTQLTTALSAVGPFIVAALGAVIGYKLFKRFAKSV